MFQPTLLTSANILFRRTLIVWDGMDERGSNCSRRLLSSKARTARCLQGARRELECWSHERLASANARISLSGKPAPSDVTSQDLRAGVSRMNFGLSSAISSRPAGFRALGATKQSSSGFKPPYALSRSRLPAQYRSISSALLAFGVAGALPPIAVSTLARQPLRSFCRHENACP
jgi:hypothetical protein